jgi:DNA modification methylase
MTDKELYILLLQEFREITGLNKWNPTLEYYGQYSSLFKGVGFSFVLKRDDRRLKLIELINKKLDLNSTKVRGFIDVAFSLGLQFNYRQKVKIYEYFNKNEVIQLEQWLIELNISQSKIESLLDFFQPINIEETTYKLTQEIQIDENRIDILSSLWGSYLYMIFEENAVHKIFLGKEEIESDFFKFLTKNYEKNLSRNLGLRCLKIDKNLMSKFKTIDIFYNSLFSYVKDSFHQLSNHTYLSIIINSDVNSSIAWQIYSKITLYAEKHISSKIKIGYFHPDKIAEQTKDYILDLDLKQCDFAILNEGFTYKDCLILTPTVFVNGKTEMSFEQYDTLILFEKNERDETLIPCPACRSKNVRGNSYPILGVKSWECNNILCPDRSKYNRGKRYSLASLIKQEAIDNSANQIDIEHQKKWRLDVATIKKEDEILEFLVKHYSLHGDKVELTNFHSHQDLIFGRVIKEHQFDNHTSLDGELSFFNAPFFNRFLVSNTHIKKQSIYQNLSTIQGVELYEGDCYDVLKNISSNKFDGAVTSPPYYNAKNYSQWNNIYCYLYDMYNIANEVYRTLKDGSPYLFNIFDYFDNENSVVFSAMGDKRMILGSYIIEIFQRIGFQLVDNIIWHKGEIQGKRNFNQGNNSPYYQAPLNCYEHIFLFSKNKPSFDYNYPKILKAKPVIKMIKGVNKLGHEAPYPLEIPMLLFSLIPKGSLILDPFAGSMTTAKACIQNGYNSVNIEYKSEYCKLGLELLENDLGLFFPRLKQTSLII